MFDIEEGKVVPKNSLAFMYLRLNDSRRLDVDGHPFMLDGILGEISPLTPEAKDYLANSPESVISGIQPHYERRKPMALRELISRQKRSQAEGYSEITV